MTRISRRVLPCVVGLLVTVCLAACSQQQTQDAASAEAHNFSVRGDVSEISKDARVYVVRSYYEESGNRATEELVSAEITDGIVDLRGTITKPTVVNVVVEVEGGVRDRAPVVIEPGAEIYIRHVSEMIGNIADGTGSHQKFLGWQSEDAYVQAMNDYTDIMRVRQQLVGAAEMAEASAKTASTEGIEGADDVPAQTTADAENGAASDSTETAEQAAPEQAEKPANVIASVLLEKLDSTVREELRERIQELAGATYEKLNEIKLAALNELGNAEDPYVALMAIELGAFGATQEALVRLEALSVLLPEDVVAVRVKPRTGPIRMHLQRVANDESLPVGNAAPDFTASNFTEEQVNLYSTLAGKEVVLVDFWASWCGPCIKTFPHLKELYAEYGEKGFEIVSISVDDTNEDWSEATEEHQLPWLNLGDISSQGFGPIATAYGVTFIPKGYLLDKGGNIVGKDLRTAKLEELLAERLDEPDAPAPG